MRQSKNSKEAQGVRTAQQLQEQFNIATLDLHQTFHYKELKPCIDNLLLGWICSDYFEMVDTSNKGTIFSFFTNTLDYFHKIELEAKTNEAPVCEFSFFHEVMNSKNYGYCNDVKKTFNQTLRFYLQSTVSNDWDFRFDVTSKVKVLKKYFKKIERLKIQYQSLQDKTIYTQKNIAISLQ